MTNFYTFHLNDQALQIKDSETVLYSSPGIACLLKDRIISGLEARPLLSKHPSLISTEHWYKINHSETSIQSNYKITNADLVYSQLIKMWSKLTKKKPVVIIYPSEYTEDKLEKLCGVFDAVGVKIVGLINSDLSSLEQTDFLGTLHVIRIQLNYTAHILIRSKESFLLKSIECHENKGLIQLNDQLIRSLRKVFVRQCRVDPLINCESEHYMRVQLAHWLKQSKQKEKFFADTLINGNPYRAEVDSETILSVCRNFFKDISENRKSSRLILCPTIFSLSNNICANQSFYKLSSPKLNTLIQSMALEKTEELVVNLNDNFPNYGFANKIDERKKTEKNPTHILRDNHGHKLSDSPIEFTNGNSKILIFKRDGEIFLEPNGSLVFINNSLEKKEARIIVGDSINFGGNSEFLKAIRIES